MKNTITVRATETDKLCNLANKYLQKQDISNVIDTLETALGILPTCYRALAGLARIYYMTKNFARTIKLGQQAIELKPSIDISYLAVALAYKELGQPNRSIEMLETATKNCEQCTPDIPYQLSRMYLEQGKAILARAIIKKVVSNCTAAAYEHQLACCHNALGDYDFAIQTALKAIAIDPDYAQVYGVLGTAYWCAGDVVSASKSFKKGLRMDPSQHLIKEELEKLEKKSFLWWAKKPLPA